MNRFLLILLALAYLSPLARAQTLQSKPTATAPAGDDWMLLQGDTYGMRKLGPTYFQPSDPDLTSLAAISSTGVLVYRSGANTWSPVTIGTGLQFSAGTLNNTGGVWGGLSGTLSNQTDLNTALAAKVAGPASATDGAVVLYDGTTGKLVKSQSTMTYTTGGGGVLFVPTISTSVGIEGPVGYFDTLRLSTLFPTTGAFISARTNDEHMELNGNSFLLQLLNGTDLFTLNGSAATFYVPLSATSGTITTVNSTVVNTGTVNTGVAQIDKVNVTNHDSGGIGNGSTLTLSNTYTTYRATFTGATATIALPTPIADGVWRVDGYSTYVAGPQVITIPSLIRPEQDLDTPITSFTVPATSGGRWTAYFFAQNGAFTKVSIIGDTISQRDLAAFHSDASAEFTALANKATPTTSDTIAIEDAAASDAKKKATLGALPISTATQAALDGKANLTGGNTWLGTQTMEVVQAPFLQLAASSAPATAPSGYVYFYADSSRMPNLKDDSGNVIPLGIPPHLVVAVSDETTALTTGDARVTIRAPRALTLTGVRASLNTASSSGLVTVRIKKNGTTIFSTNLTIDQGEKTSVTAATAAVLSTAAIADDDELTFDIVGAGTGAKGLKVALYYR